MNDSLLDLLRNGGYILYARHGEATVGEDQPDLDFRYCYTQRNLSNLGRKQAAYFGVIFRALKVPVSYPVTASSFRRAIETAQLAFGRLNVQIDLFWTEVYNSSRNLTTLEQERILEALRSKLEIAPPQGTNQVIIAHGYLGQIPNMGTVIIKPLGQGNGFEIIDMLTLDDLAGL